MEAFYYHNEEEFKKYILNKRRYDEIKFLEIIKRLILTNSNYYIFFPIQHFPINMSIKELH